MTASHMRALLRQLPQAKRENVHMYRSFDPILPSLSQATKVRLIWSILGMAAPANSKVAIDQIEEVAPFIVDLG